MRFAALGGGRGGFFFDCSLVEIAVWMFLFGIVLAEMKVLTEVLYPGLEMLQPRVPFWITAPQ